MKRSIYSGLGLFVLTALVPGVAAAQNAPALRLFDDTGFSGGSVRIDRGVENLESLRFNDDARSLIAEGRWEICLDAGFSGGCRVVQGRVSDMGDWNGSVSSVRYLGPGDWGSSADTASTSTGPALGGGAAAGGQTPAGTTYRVDYRPEMIGRIYDTDFGVMTIDRYDRDGASGRYEGAAADGSDSGTFDGLVRPADHAADGYDTLEGYWYQSHASQRCASARNGTYYWGRVQLNFPIESNEFIGFFSHCDGTPLDRWNGTYEGRDPVIAAAVDAQTAGQPGGAPISRQGADTGVRQPGGVDAEGRPLPGVVERAADVAADEVERQVHDRIREGIGRIF